MDHIRIFDNTLQYIPSLSMNYDFFFGIIAGIVFICVYIFKLPFNWFRNPKYPAPRLIALYLGLALLFLGAYSFITTPTKKVLFNNTEKKMSIIQESKIKTERDEYSFSEIKNITIIRGKKTRNDYYYYLTITLSNNKTLQIGEYAENTDYYDNYTDLLSDGQRIANYIQVPFYKPDSPINKTIINPTIGE